MGAPAVQLVNYPESDGKPMAETDIHRDEMFESIEALKNRYRGNPDVYVAGNLLIYYEEGNPAACFAPDCFVVLGVPKRRRRVYKLWLEQKAPSFVLEVTSRGTRLEDKGSKRELCAELGIEEYFLYDPEDDYLHPALQGFRLRGGEYAAIKADASGRLESEVLGLLLTRDGEGQLRFVDPATDVTLLRIEEQVARAAHESERAEQEAQRAEHEAQRAEHEAQRAEREAQRAEHEAQRANAAEAELTRLRALLADR